MLAEYDRLIGQCRTENDLNRVHIAFGNTITPQEVLILEESLFVDGVHSAPELRQDCAFSPADLRRVARTWIEELREDLQRVGKREAEQFRRRDVRKSVTLYSDGGEPSGKTLLLTLPGANHRMMMPIATFLQNLPASSVDVLMIRDGTRTGYRGGLEGLASSIEELGPALPGLLDISAYRRRAGLGVSAGGLPIVLVALCMGFDAVMSCGGGSPNNPRWQRPGLPSPAETLRRDAARSPDCAVTIAFGAQSEPDRKSANDIVACVPSKLVEVALPDLEVRHNILHPLSTNRLLPAFFEKHLGIGP